MSRGRARGKETSHLEDDVRECVCLALDCVQWAQGRLVETNLGSSPSRRGNRGLDTLACFVRVQDDAVRKVVEDCAAGVVDADVAL
jgi:hypothetical protein